MQINQTTATNITVTTKCRKELQFLVFENRRQAAPAAACACFSAPKSALGGTKLLAPAKASQKPKTCAWGEKLFYRRRLCQKNNVHIFARVRLRAGFRFLNSFRNFLSKAQDYAFLGAFGPSRSLVSRLRRDCGWGEAAVARRRSGRTVVPRKHNL